MGLFDNVFNALDKTLKDIEEGGLERRITGALDMLDQGIQKAPEVLEKAADAPEKLMEQIDAKTEAVQSSATGLRESAGKTIDIIQRQD